MASLTDYFNNATFNLFKPKTALASSSQGTPVSIGPVPTPVPPSGKAYTPQYSGSTTFTTTTPPAYTSTPQGQKEVRLMQTSSGTSSVTKDNLLSNYPGYAGWNPDAAWQDYLATGGAGKGGSTNTTSSDGTGDTTPAPNPLLTKTYSTGDLTNSLTNTGTGTPTSDIWTEIYQAAEAGNQSAIDAINSQYGQNETELNRQLGLTDQYQSNDLNTLLSQFNATNTDIGTQRASAGETVSTETGKAADQARNTQRQNRNVLRALGILGSTYAAENLAAPINQFDKQKAELVNWGTKRLAELDNYYNQKKTEYDNLVRDVTTKYGDLRTKIMGDLRYNAQQKADALKAATAGAQQNIAHLNMQKASYETQLNQYKQGLQTQIAQMLMTKTPTANLQDIANQSIAFTNSLMGTSPNKQTAIYQGSGTVSRYPAEQYIGWDPVAAQADWAAKQGRL